MFVKKINGEIFGSRYIYRNVAHTEMLSYNAIYWCVLITSFLIISPVSAKV